jgi:hypothetical protein
MINQCNRNKLASRLWSPQQLSIRKALQLQDLLHKIRGIEIVSIQLIITFSAVLVELTPITVKCQSPESLGTQSQPAASDSHSLFMAFNPRECIIWPLEPLYKTHSESHSASLSYPLAHSRLNQECSGASNMASSSAIKALLLFAVVLLLSQALMAPVLCRQLSENQHSEKEASKSSTQTKVIRTSNSVCWWLMMFHAILSVLSVEYL